MDFEVIPYDSTKKGIRAVERDFRQFRHSSEPIRGVLQICPLEKNMYTE